MNTLLFFVLFSLKYLLEGTGHLFRTTFSSRILAYGLFFFMMLLTAAFCALIVRKFNGANKPFSALLVILLLAAPSLNSYTFSLFSLGAHLLCLLPLLALLCRNVGEKKALVLACFTSAAAAVLAPVTVAGLVPFSNLTLCFASGDPSPKKLLRRMLPPTLISVAACCAASVVSLLDQPMQVLYRIDYYATAIALPSGLRFLEHIHTYTAAEIIASVVLPLLTLGVGFGLTKVLRDKSSPKNAPAFDACRRELLILVPFTAFSVVFFSAMKYSYSPALFEAILMLIIFFRHDEVKEELSAFLKQNVRYLLPLLIFVCGVFTALLINEHSLLEQFTLYY